MKNFSLNVILNLQGTILTSGGGDVNRGIHKLFFRNSFGEPVLQASHIKGKLREALNELIKSGAAINIKLDDFFGIQNDEGIYRPQQGMLQFSDFMLLTQQNIKKSKLTKVSIHDITGTSKENFLQILEKLFESGSETLWAGKIEFVAEDVEKAKQTKELILVGFRWITAFGSSKGSGMGIMKNVKIELKEEAISQQKKPTIPEKQTEFNISIELMEDLLVGGVRRTTNFIESEKVISGAVLKGSLASCLNRICGTYPLFSPIDQNNKEVVEKFPDLAKHFSDIRFCHAFPCPPGSAERPVVLPLSIVKISANKFADVALTDDPILDTELKAPAFHVDWKSTNDENGNNIYQLFGWAEHRIVNKTRTAIQSNLRSAEENQLYTFQYISPYEFSKNGADKKPQKNLWISNIILPDHLDKETLGKLAEQFYEAITACWNYLGKRRTRIKANFEIGLKSTKMLSNSLIKNGLSIITLQTDTVILNSDEFKNTNQLTDFFQSYNNYWTEISDGLFTLKNFYASQRLMGGYLFHRYEESSQYYPYFLTEAGSVFVLNANMDMKEEAEDLIRKWLSNGLPLPKWAINKYKSDKPIWDVFPFVPENGFGEVAVNLSWHWEKQL